jgi:hypothetical protein
VTRRPSNRALWFGVAGGPLAWTIQFVANLAFSFAQCNQPTTRWQLPVHGWVIGLSAGAVAVALAAMAVCARIFLRTFRIDDVFATERSGGGTQPPLGRIHFLAIVGLIVNLLALAIIVMTGVGAPLLPVCEQS